MGTTAFGRLQTVTAVRYRPIAYLIAVLEFINFIDILAPDVDVRPKPAVSERESWLRIIFIARLLYLTACSSKLSNGIDKRERATNECNHKQNPEQYLRRPCTAIKDYVASTYARYGNNSSAPLWLHPYFQQVTDD
jgi:hypothetical protein